MDGLSNSDVALLANNGMGGWNGGWLAKADRPFFFLEKV